MVEGSHLLVLRLKGRLDHGRFVRLRNLPRGFFRARLRDRDDQNLLSLILVRMLGNDLNVNKDKVFLL